MADWLTGKIIEKIRWNDRLFSLRIQCDFKDFESGQFVRVALDIDGERIARPYSLVNTPADESLEVYFNLVPEGPLTPKLAELEQGDEIFVTDRANGFLTVAEIPECKNLWLLATGTGVGPFISILKNKDTSKEDQEFYLKLMVHLVGDLHQPLHVGLADDKGGNDFQVRWFNRGTNLHRVWDSDMIDSNKMSYTELSDNMVQYPKKWIKAKQNGSIDQWADEIHLVAEKVYQSAEIGEKLGYRYSYDYFNTARMQLYLAGIRLAKILNDIYG